MLRMRGGSIAVACVFIFTAMAVHPALAATSDHIVVAEVQVGGASAKDEFIELYNPTATSISIEGWRLSKRTGSGAREENLVTSFPALTIPSRASVLVAHPDGVFAASADQKYTTQSSIAIDNTVVLYGPAGSDGQRPVIDLLGLGTVASSEGAAAPNPPTGQSLERKPGGADGNGQDTGDNVADFVLQTAPTPQPLSAAPRPAVVVPPPSEAPTPDTSTSSGSADSTPTGTTSSTSSTSSSSSSSTSSDSSTDSGSTETATSSSSTSTSTTSSSNNSPSSGLVEPSHPSMPLPAPTHVRINEFVADPVAGDEWIELINIGPVPVNLADWVIEDGAETRTLLSGGIGVGEQRFTVIAKPKGQLNNSGDRIILKNSSGNLVDAVTYGDWNDGKTNDNAPTASDPASVARVVDGMDTDNDRLDFVRTETPTRGAPNVVSAAPLAEENDVLRGTPATVQALVVLNELFPNPPGDDRSDEFIELMNLGQQQADLGGWRVRDELGAEHIIRGTDGPAAVSGGGFLVLPRSRTGIALNDTGGETVRLYKPGQERATSVATYTGDAAEGATWARSGDGRWGWTTERTPGAANVIAAPNRKPDAVFAAPPDIEIGAIATFDGSDSADPDREPLTYLWNFGDERTEADVATDAIGRYVYGEAGTYTVTLTVTDARGATTTAKRRVSVRLPRASTPSGAEQDASAAPLDELSAEGVDLALNEPGQSSSSSARTKSRASAARRSAGTPAVAFTLAELPIADVGVQVIVRGSVTAPPGTIGKQVFHIVDGDAGVEVFFGKRAIPSLSVGDRVEVRGELREVSSGLRIGIAVASDVRVLGRGPAVEPTAVRAASASTEPASAFVAVEGEVVEVRGRTIRVDDGSDEIRVALPASGADAEGVRVGDTIQATGILSRTSAGPRVLVRSAADIVTVTRPTSPTSEHASSSPIPFRDDLELAALGGGSSVVLASSLWRRRRILALAFAATRRLLNFWRRIG